MMKLNLTWLLSNTSCSQSSCRILRLRTCCAGWLTSYPLDCIRTNIQVRLSGGHVSLSLKASTSAFVAKSTCCPSQCICTKSLPHQRPPNKQITRSARSPPSRQQGQDPGKKQDSALSVGRALLAKSGVRGLYSGVTPSLLRAFLVSGSRFSAYELAMYAMHGS